MLGRPASLPEDQGPTGSEPAWELLGGRRPGPGPSVSECWAGGRWASFEGLQVR